MMKWDMTMTVIRLEESQNENSLLDFIFVIISLSEIENSLLDYIL